MARTLVEPSTEIGRRLERERISRGLTRDEWYEELDITKPTYLQWLRSTDYNIQRVNIDRIAEVMGITSVEVYGWTQPTYVSGVSRSSFGLVPAIAA